MKRTLYTLICLVLSIASSMAQYQRTLSEDIRSLQVVAGDRWMDLPIIKLNGFEQIHIDFDDMTHEYHRYVYSVEHCDANWQTSAQLFSSDFVDGFAEGNTIDDIAESVNTTFLYTHYSLTLPNSKCRLKMSGNYRVQIYDENADNRLVAQACFMVVEPIMGIQLEVTANTDRDIRGRHQQVAMAVSYGPLTISNPERELTTVLMQNNRWSTAVWNARPQYIMNDGLRWEHTPEYIFDGGNEYHKFEVLDVDHTTMGLESIQWDGKYYHAFVWADQPRYSYIYDEDANGAFYIRNSDNIENNTWSDYVYVHFQLPSPLLDGKVYLNGTWTADRLLPIYCMDYNTETMAYEKVVLLKQGYYSYHYLWNPAGSQCEPFPTEGNFYQTENGYQALVYYRRIGDRTDRLVGTQQVFTR